MNSPGSVASTTSACTSERVGTEALQGRSRRFRRHPQPRSQSRGMPSQLLRVQHSASPGGANMRGVSGGRSPPVSHIGPPDTPRTLHTPVLVMCRGCGRGMGLRWIGRLGLGIATEATLRFPLGVQRAGASLLRATPKIWPLSSEGREGSPSNTPSSLSFRERRGPERTFYERPPRQWPLSKGGMGGSPPNTFPSIFSLGVGSSTSLPYVPRADTLRDAGPLGRKPTFADIQIFRYRFESAILWGMSIISEWSSERWNAKLDPCGVGGLCDESGIAALPQLPRSTITPSLPRSAHGRSELSTSAHQDNGLLCTGGLGGLPPKPLPLFFSRGWGTQPRPHARSPSLK